MEALLAPLAGDNAGRFAKELINRFGGLGRALEASDGPDPTDDEGEALRIIRAARNLVGAAWGETVRGSPVSSRDAALGSYLRLKLGFSSEEAVLAIFIDGDGGYAGEELLAHGGASSAPLPVRRIVRRALEMGATSVLLAHNHPSGRALPSEQDYQVTDQLRGALRTVEIGLHDHLVVTRRSIFSMKDGTTT